MWPYHVGRSTGSILQNTDRLSDKNTKIKTGSQLLCHSLTGQGTLRYNLFRYGSSGRPNTFGNSFLTVRTRFHISIAPG